MSWPWKKTKLPEKNSVPLGFLFPYKMKEIGQDYV